MGMWRQAQGKPLPCAQGMGEAVSTFPQALVLQAEPAPGELVKAQTARPCPWIGAGLRNLLCSQGPLWTVGPPPGAPLLEGKLIFPFQCWLAVSDAADG